MQISIEMVWILCLITAHLLHYFYLHLFIHIHIFSCSLNHLFALHTFLKLLAWLINTQIILNPNSIPSIPHPSVSSVPAVPPSPCSSVNSAHSSASRSSGGSQTHSPSSSCRYRSLAHPPPGGAHRLSSVSSHDSGFISQDANIYSKPPSPMPSDITSQVSPPHKWTVTTLKASHKWIQVNWDIKKMTVNFDNYLMIFSILYVTICCMVKKKSFIYANETLSN